MLYEFEFSVEQKPSKLAVLARFASVNCMKASWIIITYNVGTAVPTPECCALIYRSSILAAVTFTFLP